MKLYLTKTPLLVKLLFSNWIWSFHSKKKELFLTFDDGPTPKVTDWVLEELKKYEAKATFFCIGKNIDSNPKLFERIKAEGHAVGNHTQNHFKSTDHNTRTYLKNIAETSRHFSGLEPKLFRPPYGKLGLRKAKALRKLGYKIIMWDVLSADFDTSISEQKCLNNVIANTQKGSIIVFHDSQKASKKLRFVLPKILEYYSYKGFEFKSIT